MIVVLEQQNFIGTAWCRLWTNDNQGYGYLDSTTPELAIAVLAEYRGQGIGTLLLQKLLETLRVHCPALSLSVRSDNPVVNLSHRLGFEEVPSKRHFNRVGGYSLTMVYHFAE